jgi:hypothetical protein
MCELGVYLGCFRRKGFLCNDRSLVREMPIFSSVFLIGLTGDTNRGKNDVPFSVFTRCVVHRWKDGYSPARNYLHNW